ncbi:MAG: DNA/RNA non-specific endonuclease [Clostridia bacterium]|nr:DNA/RNA non-specific endonuclease [Clostridia bacterium]
MKTRALSLLALLLVLALAFSGCDLLSFLNPQTPATQDYGGPITWNGIEIPAYSGKAYISLNGGKPTFTESDYTTKSYEFYSDLDSLGRCGYTMACVGIDIMPTEDRGSISSVKPTGWINKSYDIVDGGYLYNRCHLIGHQLTGEDANARNLITGTRYMNVQGMLPFENEVADYVKETENHVLYRVTPVFIGNELLARGVQIEAYSVEDEGDEIYFNVYVYNVQPGIILDYATGENRLDTDPAPETEPDDGETPAPGGETDGETVTYVLNTNTKRFHKPECSSVRDMSEKNKQEYTGTREALVEDGYVACGSCKP